MRSNLERSRNEDREREKLQKTARDVQGVERETVSRERRFIL